MEHSQLFVLDLSIYDDFTNPRFKIKRRAYEMEAEFAEKVVLVTGATSGIGRACAMKFASAGARIAAVGRNEEALAKLS